MSASSILHRVAVWTWSRRHSVAALLVAVVFCRMAGFLFGILNIDESDFAVVGRMWLEGALPYVGVVDNKPPLTYVVYWLASPLGHFSMLPVQVLAVAWVLATCLVLKATVEAWRGDVEAGWVAAWCGLLATMCEIPAVNAELLMNLPAAVALYLFVRADRSQRWLPLLGSGLAIGLAGLFKPPAGILLAGFGLGVLAPAWRGGPGQWRRASAQLTVLACGFALPWLAVLCVYARLGHAPDFLEWVLQENLAALDHFMGPVWARAATSVVLCVGGGAPLLWWLAARQSFRPRGGVEVALATSLWLTWIPVSLGGRFYEHYFLQFAPLLAVLAAPGLTAIARRWGHLGPVRRGAVLVFLFGPAVGLVGYSLVRGITGHYPGQEPRARAVAEWLRSHSRPADRVFVWGHYSPIYFLSDRIPGTRFVNASMLIGNYDPGQLPDDVDVRPLVSERQVRRLMVDLERKPEWFVDTSPSDIHHWSRVPLAAFPELKRLLLRSYRLETEVASTPLWTPEATRGVAALRAQ